MGKKGKSRKKAHKEMQKHFQKWQKEARIKQVKNGRD